MNPLLLTSMAAVSTSVGGYCAVCCSEEFICSCLSARECLLALPCWICSPPHCRPRKAQVHRRHWFFPSLPSAACLSSASATQRPVYRANKVGNRAAGRVSASFLVVHSTLDGTAILAAATISLQLGLIVGLGVVAHDICDGSNTILLATGAEKPGWTDYGFLALDALAPIAGGLIAAHLFRGSDALVMVFLSLAAGSFLFTAFFSLLPDASRRANRSLVLSLGVLGFLLMLCLTRLVGALG